MVRDRLILPSSDGGAGIEQLPTLMTLILPAQSKPIEDLRQELKSAGCEISVLANDVLDAMPLQHRERDEEIELVVISPKALSFGGFNRLRRSPASTYAHVCTIAESLGLKKCPAEVGPLLRKALANQPWGRTLLIAMEPKRTTRGNVGIFGLVALYTVGNLFKKQNWLIASDYSNESVCYPDDQFVFVRPKKSPSPSEVM